MSNFKENMVHNAMTSRNTLLERMFDPRRDIDAECGYAKTIGDEDYRVMYDRELGSRVVNIYPNETWKRKPEISEDPDPEVTTPFEEALEALEQKHGLCRYMKRIDKLSGIGQYGVLLWGLSDGKRLHEPVDGSDTWVSDNPTTGKLKLNFIRAFDASLVRVAAYDGDATSPRFGLPTFYNLLLHDPRTEEVGSVVSTPNTKETQVHWSRITHIADNRETSEVLGVPRMQPVWNRLCDLRKILGGSGEMFWKGGFPGISLETQSGLENAELDEEKTRAMMSDYQNGLQRYLALTGMSAKSLSPQISDPSPQFEVQIKSICVTLGVPYRVFLGVEEGVVSGDQATNAWNERLVERQNQYVTPEIINPILERLQLYGVLPPTAEPLGWSITWPDLTIPSEKDKVIVAKEQTTALAAYVAGGVDTLIQPLDYFTKVLHMDPDEAEQVLNNSIDAFNDEQDEEETEE